jgi:hypothetical protein
MNAIIERPFKLILKLHLFLEGFLLILLTAFVAIISLRNDSTLFGMRRSVVVIITIIMLVYYYYILLIIV